MKHPQPRPLSRRRVAQLLSETKYARSTGTQINFLSRHFLGHSYKTNPLIGSADTAEVFKASFDGFDCVTYIETVLALARAANLDDFIEGLQKSRDEQGCIHWEQRNQVMSVWIVNNGLE